MFARHCSDQERERGCRAVSCVSQRRHEREVRKCRSQVDRKRKRYVERTNVFN